MKIIADSGSSKTNWIIAGDEKGQVSIDTQGLNPNFSSLSHISSVVKENILPATGGTEDIEIFFYGSGCSDKSLCGKIKKAIHIIFPHAEIEVNTDLLGAARALHGDMKGIACILGTGSNSCLYDGKSIVSNIPPLGFILGDEGSGSYLGKRLLSDFLKGIMPADVSELFSAKYDTDKDLVIKKVYRGEFPNKYIASFVVFLKDNISNPYCYSLVEDAFIDFLNRNVRYYENFHKLDIGFTGSIAWYFEEILRKVMASYGLRTKEIIKEPAERILKYHLSK